MRFKLAVLVPLTLAAGLLWPGRSDPTEKDLLAKFKQQNEQGKEKVKEDVKLALEAAAALEADEPEKALGLLQVTRDRLLQKGFLVSKEDRELDEPLWSKIQVLRTAVREKQAALVKASLSEYKEYLARLNEEFHAIAKEFTPYGKEPPPGVPAYFAFINGTTMGGWLNAPPVYVVHAIIQDQNKSIGPGLVTGVQTAKGYYLFQPESRQYVPMTNPEFFITAIASYTPARKPGFWLPSEYVPKYPGFHKRLTGAMGASMFARSAGLLMTSWANPAGPGPDHTLGLGEKGGLAAAQLYRDVTIDLKVQEAFSFLTKDRQARLRDEVMAFLDRRPTSFPLAPDELGHLVEMIADAYPDRRPEAVSFAIQVNRILEQISSKQKK